MTEPLAEQNLQEHLTAFADGELDASETVAVLEYLAVNPDALAWMRNQQRLRVVAERALRTATPPVPEALRRRVAGLAAVGVVRVLGPRAASWRKRVRVPSLVAAALVVGLLAGRWGSAPSPAAGTVAFDTEPDPVVPVTLVLGASRAHAACSRLATGLHAAGYPEEMGTLRRAVQADLGGDHPYPRLSDMGYEFAGAGPCAAPLADAVHLLYRQTDQDAIGAVSVFVQPNAGQFQLQRGKLYLLSGPRSTFPMFAWRSDAVIYYLVTDDLEAARRARQLITGAPEAPAIEW